MLEDFNVCQNTRKMQFITMMVIISICYKAQFTPFGPVTFCTQYGPGNIDVVPQPHHEKIFIIS